MNTEPNSTTEAVSAPSVGTTAPKGAAAAKAKSKRPSKPVVTKGKPAKKAKAPKTTAKAKKPAKAITGNRLVPADLSTYKISKDKPTAGGNPSVDCDDKVAALLRGKTLAEVYKVVAAKIEDMSEGQLRAKYKSLNVGMQRMNLGNKLRGVLNAK